MKKQIIIATVVIASLAAYTLLTSEELTTERNNFVGDCATNDGIYAEGVLTEKQWRPEGCTDEECVEPDAPKESKGHYLLEFTKSSMHKPTLATLPGVKGELDARRHKLEKGKSYSVCMKQDFVLIDYYKSF